MHACKRLFLLIAAVPCLWGLAGAATVRGVVRDADTGKPLEGVNVAVQGHDAGGKTDAEGRYAIEDLTGNPLTLRATRVGYAPEESRVSTASGSVTADFALRMVALPGAAVTVTASRAVERETPATFSNITKAELEDRFHTQGIPTLLSELPSVQTWSETGNGIGYTYLTLRGFDQRRVSVMINGVPQNDPEDHNVYWVNLPDLGSSLEDIQVQRGPGSAFYGPAAVGGSINLVTERFGSGPRMTLTGGYGSYDTRKFGLTLNSGLLDGRSTFYAHLGKTQSDGYRDKAWLDFLSYFLGGARYTTGTVTRFQIYGSLNRDHLNYYGIPRFKKVGSGQVDALRDGVLRRENPIAGDEEIEDFHQPHYELIHEWTVNPNLTVTNTGFYVQGGGYFDFDASWADTTYFRLTSATGFKPTGNPGRSLVRAFVNNRQGGWLPRVSYVSGRSTTEAGLELRYHRSLHWGQVRWAENLPRQMGPEFRYYEYKGSMGIGSFYLNQTFRATDRLNVRANLQVAYRRYRLYDEKYAATAFTVPYAFVNPTAGINYNLTGRVNAYASFARTSREPRLKNLYDAGESSGGALPQFQRTTDGMAFDFSRPLAKPERLNDWEVGGGYRSANLRASVNLFWMDFRDEIVKNGQLDRFGQPVTGNAERSIHRGIELSGAAKVAGCLTLQGNLSLSRNTLEKYVVYRKGKPVVLDGNRLGGYPDLLANARMTYERKGFTASLWCQAVGRQYTDNTENNRRTPEARSAPGYVDLAVDPYSVVNLGVGYDIGRLFGGRRFEVRADVQNLLNRLYVTHGEGAAFFPAAPRNLFVWTKIDL